MYLANQACQCLSAYRHCHLWIQKKTREPRKPKSDVTVAKPEKIIYSKSAAYLLLLDISYAP